MQIKKPLAILSFLFALVLLSSCQTQAAVLVNTQTIDLAGIGRIEITYSSDKVIVREHDSNTLVLKEYMSIDRQEYYASINSNNDNIIINSGRRPATMASYVEVYLPSAYNGSFSVTTSSGKIEVNSAYHFDSFAVRTASGAIEIMDVTVSESRINTSSGAVNIGSITGNMIIDSNSGRIRIDNASGSGSFKTSSGAINISFSNVDGNISCNTSSGKIELAIPDSLSFNFTARTSSGSIRTPFSDGLAATSNSASGSVGTDPAVNINLSTSSGGIEVGYR